MPQDPLVAELLARAQAKVTRTLHVPQAGEASPETVRGWGQMRKDFPADMVNVQVKDMDWRSPEAFSNVLAATPSKLPESLASILGPNSQGDPESIEVNPGSAIIEPSSSINSILAHELQHVRQNRSDADPMTRFLQRKLPYQDQPDEMEAFKASRDYEDAHPAPKQRSPLSEAMVMSELQRLFEGNNTQRK